MKDCRKIFCERLKELRGNGTQQEIAEILGIKQNTNSNFERGTREPGLQIVAECASHFGVSTDWLLGLDDSRLPSHHVTATGGSAVASASPGARVSASTAAPQAPSATEISRLLGIIESQQRVIEALTGTKPRQ